MALSKTQMVAPCGMNCRFCYAHMREKNQCSGCRSTGNGKPAYCSRCKIGNCTKREGKFCFDCKEYPCKHIKHMDKRYRNSYDTSMIDNLNMIKEKGVRAFVAKDEKDRSCPRCGEYVSVHWKVCKNCTNTG